MLNLKNRESKIAIAEQRKIRLLQPQIDKIENVTDNLEKIESLDKWRKIIAYNTLKQWQKRIKDKSLKRNDLLDHRQRELSKE